MPSRGRHSFSEVCLQHTQTVIQPCMWFMEEPSQFSFGQTPQSLTCSIMEPLTGLDDCLNMLLSWSSEYISAWNWPWTLVMCLCKMTSCGEAKPQCWHLWYTVSPVSYLMRAAVLIRFGEGFTSSGKYSSLGTFLVRDVKDH